MISIEAWKTKSEQKEHSAVKQTLYAWLIKFCFYHAAADKPFFAIWFSGRHPVPCTEPNNLVCVHRVLAGKYKSL